MVGRPCVGSGLEELSSPWTGDSGFLHSLLSLLSDDRKGAPDARSARLSPGNGANMEWRALLPRKPSVQIVLEDS